VSVGYFAILLAGFLLWISYVIAARNLALIVPNTVALLIGASTIAIALRLRESASGRQQPGRDRRDTHVHRSVTAAAPEAGQALEAMVAYFKTDAAGMPAPPARIRSTSLLCGTSSSDICPDWIWRSASDTTAGRAEKHVTRWLIWVVVGEQVGRREARLTQPVAVDREPGRPLVAQRGDQAEREAVRDAKPRDAGGRAVPDVRHRRSGRSHQLFNRLT
jgi:hypothetical protein